PAPVREIRERRATTPRRERAAACDAPVSGDRSATPAEGTTRPATWGAESWSTKMWVAAGQCQADSERVKNPKNPPLRRRDRKEELLKMRRRTREAPMLYRRHGCEPRHG